MTVLACTDRSENSIAALKYAEWLAHALGEELEVVCTLDLWERGEDDQRFATLGEVGLEASDEGRALVESFIDEVFDERPVLHVLVGHPPAERITDLADKRRVSLIVAGTSGQSRLTEAFFGSTISALARSANQPLLAVPPDFAGGIAHVLAPVDFSPCSWKSLEFAGKLSTRLGASLRVQHVAPFGSGSGSIAPPLAYVPQSATKVAKEAAEHLRSLVESLDLTEQVTGYRTDVGAPHAEIMAAVDEYDIDLVVIGTHGRKGIARFFLGSTAERLLRERTCPVLVVRHTE